MTPSVLNRICAYPVVVSWVLGACAVDTMVVNQIPLSAIATDWQAMLWLLILLIPASLLGLFLGMFTCWPWVRVICSRYNSAPLKAGDRVMVLSGPLKRTVAEVYEISVGQGGWNLARLNLGPERQKNFKDIFEEYSLLKLAGEQGTAPNSRPPCQLPPSLEIPTVDSQRTPSSGGCG